MSWGNARRDAGDVGWRPPTTYVDVLFLILTFFITIASFREEDQRMDVSLPATETNQPQQKGHAQITVTVRDDGRIFMGDREYTPETLRGTLLQLAKQFPEESILIRGDKESRLGMTVKVMDLAYEAGVHKVFLATTKAASEVGK
jgi:biopolymer transport protein ExbD